jgi:galactokinase
VKELRDLGEADLPLVAALDDVIARRARHVITENARVLRAVQALERGDGPELGRLFALSHESMRRDYEVSIPEIDLLVALASAEPGVHGARLTGGGFGGSIVLLADAGKAAAAARSAARSYAERTGEKPLVLVPDLGA